MQLQVFAEESQGEAVASAFKDRFGSMGDTENAESINNCRSNDSSGKNENNYRDQQHSLPNDNWWTRTPPDRRIELLFTAAITVATIVNVGIANKMWSVAETQATISDRQAGIMDKQAAVSRVANDINSAAERAFVSAKDIRIETRKGDFPGDPSEPYWWFSPVIENSGNTPTKDLHISAEAVIDPSRPDVEVRLPLGFVLGAKQGYT